MLAMQGGLAQLYSENLGREVKKGWAERRAQGLYCGLLAFGAKKGDDGIPLKDPETHQGLQLMFELGAQGHSDRQVAAALNAGGYRTAGNQGSRLFSKYTVKGILTNRFYIGFIPDGKGGWLKAKHDPLIAPELFEAAQEARKRNRRKPTRNVRADARVSALSGLARCRSCGATLRTFRNRGIARLICNTRLKNSGCLEPSAQIRVYEQAMAEFLEAFRLPAAQKERVVNQRARDVKFDRPESLELGRLVQARERVADMFKWGHLSRSEYLRERQELERAIEILERSNPDDGRLQEFTRLVNDVQAAWAAADDEGKNKLAHAIFDAVWIENKRVVAVTPRPELTPLFDRAWQAAPDSVLHWRPRADLNRRSLP
ncbi:MAG: recombinase family protein [Chloroflexi bacterium]|nr:recombinase family protein [Chloroflexota bacterium]